MEGSPAKQIPCIKRTIRKVLKSKIKGCTNAKSDTDITENIIIGLRPKTSDSAPKNSIAIAKVIVAADSAKLATVSLTLKAFVKCGISGCTL